MSAPAGGPSAVDRVTWTTSRIVLESEEKLFDTLHRRLCDRGYARPPWDRLDASALGEAELVRVREAWADRAVGEYRSMIVFGEILARLPEIGMPLSVSTAASRLISDEARHTELCEELAERLGASPEGRIRPSDLRLDTAMPAHLFVARWTASMFSVGESASVGVLAAMRTRATDPCVSAIVRTLLRDERLHDELGWALARLVLPRLSDDEVEWLAADLVHTFRHYERMHAGDVSASPPREGPGEGALGLVSREVSGRAFIERAERVIVPNLASLGIPAWEAWEVRRELGRGAP